MRRKRALALTAAALTIVAAAKAEDASRAGRRQRKPKYKRLLRLK